MLEVVGFLAQYGLLTETGAAPDWNLALSGGGREIAADELLALVKDGALADDTVVNVDGTPVTVADLKVMLEIEEYIAYLQETYFDGHQWSQEQLDSLDSLMEQINSEGIDVLAPEGSEAIQFPSGVDHTAVASMSLDSVTESSAEVTVRLNHSLSQDVLVRVRTLPGSATDSLYSLVDRYVPIPAGTTEQTISVSIKSGKEINYEGGPAFYIQLNGIIGVRGAQTLPVFLTTDLQFPRKSVEYLPEYSGNGVSIAFGGAWRIHRCEGLFCRRCSDAEVRGL